MLGFPAWVRRLLAFSRRLGFSNPALPSEQQRAGYSLLALKAHLGCKVCPQARGCRSHGFGKPAALCVLQDARQLQAARPADQDKFITAICRVLASEAPLKEKVCFAAMRTLALPAQDSKVSKKGAAGAAWRSLLVCCPCPDQAAVSTHAVVRMQTNLLAYMEARLLGNNANSNMFINCLELAELLVGAYQ